MSVVEAIHDCYIHDRHTHVLSGYLTNVIPGNFSLLDVGSGDGRSQKAT
jgi:hypothetical protein